MSAVPGQFNRKVSLMVVEGEKALDLSDLKFTFETKQDDEQQPSNCSVRVFNLSATTEAQVRKEYSRIILQAGFEGQFGVIFDGTIKQFHTGKMPDNTNTFLDILAADGDVGYNFGVTNKTLAAGSNSGERVAAAIAAMSAHGVDTGKILIDGTGGVLPRGKVLFGLSRAILSSEAQTNGATWSIQDGKVNMIPLTGYLPGEAVVLNSASGLLGRAEQTQDGVRARCLLNPKIVVGGLVKIDNRSVNQTLAQAKSAIPAGQLPYNQWAGVQQFASVTADGLYRVYVAEHTGDTRGNDYYTDLILLAVDPVTKRVQAYG